jgi:hypothetical protein
MHASARCVSGLGTRRKLCRAAHGESSARGFDVRTPRVQLLHAMDLSVHPFQGGSEYLLALEGTLGCARKSFVLSAAPCRSLHGALRAPTCFLYRACREGVGAKL